MNQNSTLARDLTITHIGELFTADSGNVPCPNDQPVRILHNAFIKIRNGRILELGSMAALDEKDPLGYTVDAAGGTVVPGLIDSHTHLIFAGTREKEFVLRSSGSTYLEIASAGGGILNTVRAVRSASLDELVALALPRLARMLANGVTTVEVKSGYSLDVEGEIKMLEVVRLLNKYQPIELVPTFLAAHTIPPEFENNRKGYIDLVTSDECMGRVANDRLAEFCDVFCEASAFTIDESRRVLLAGRDCGLAPKLHADQITQMGASRLAAEVMAVTAEHLEHVDDGGIQALSQAGVIAGLLPGCSFYLGVQQAPVRRLLKAGIPVAIATDYNPGSSMVESLPLVLSIACTQAGMTPSEALVGATANAAAALNRKERLGVLRPTLQADLVILDVASVNLWLSQIGQASVRSVIKEGNLVYERGS